MQHWQSAFNPLSYDVGADCIDAGQGRLHGGYGLISWKKGKMLDGAMWFGKVCTAVLFAGLLVLFLFSQLEAAVVNGIIMIMMGIMIVTLCMYVPVFQKMKHKEKKDGEE